MDADEADRRQREIAELQARLDALKGETKPAKTPHQRAGVGCAVVLAVLVLVILVAGLSTCAGDDASNAKQSGTSEVQTPPAPANQAALSRPAIEIPPELASRCDIAECPAGTIVVTAPAKDGAFFACRSEALSDYTNFVLGLVAMQKELTGSMPNIDPETGEPAYQEQTRQMLNELRSKAGVTTFDQAVAMCARGPHRQKVTVMNFEKGRTSTWVGQGKSGASYWVPTNELELPRQRR